MFVKGQEVRVEKRNKKTGKLCGRGQCCRVLRVFGGYAFLSNGHIIPEYGHGHTKEAKAHRFQYFDVSK